MYFPILRGQGEEEHNGTIFPDLISFENSNEQIREPAGRTSQQYTLTCMKPQSWNILQLLQQAEGEDMAQIHFRSGIRGLIGKRRGWS